MFSATKIAYQFALLCVASIGCIACASTPSNTCSEGWKVTGYYTPLESDYETPNQTITVRNTGNLQFNSTFLRSVKMEGWGLTRFGWYLGYYSNQWHASSSPLNALGHPLVVGTAAVDTRVIALSNKIAVPHAGQLLNIQEFTALDVGSAVKERHIDIYTGEGNEAKQLTWQITRTAQVCLL